MTRTVDTSQQVDDWGRADLQCELRIEVDRSITVDWRARLRDDPGDGWKKTGSVSVPARATPADPPARVVVDLVRSEMAWPVRAHIEFEVHNDIAPWSPTPTTTPTPTTASAATWPAPPPSLGR